MVGGKLDICFMAIESYIILFIYSKLSMNVVNDYRNSKQPKDIKGSMVVLINRGLGCFICSALWILLCIFYNKYCLNKKCFLLNDEFEY